MFSKSKGLGKSILANRNAGFSAKCHKTFVMGSEKGVGVTHFSILLANYYAEILGRKTAIIDLNKDRDYSLLEEMCRPEGAAHRAEYRIRKVTYYPGMNKEKMAEVFGKGYQSIVIDAGSNAEYYRNEISMCDSRFFIGAVNPWKISTYLDSINGYLKVYNMKDIDYLYTFGDSDSVKYLTDVTGKELFQIPVIYNPFSITGKQLDSIEKIIWNKAGK